MSVSAADAQFVRDIVRYRSAISLDASKDYLIESRLYDVARRHGFANLEQLVARARAGEPLLHTAIVEAITTHETSFYRDIHPFNLLRQDVLPALVAARENQRTLTVWSAACSSGQEPYSIAMMLLDSFPELATWHVQIIATDLSEQVLAKARQGLFNQLEVNRGLPIGHLIKYFDREGMHYRVREQVRKLVDFRQANLLETAALRFRPDVVFLRNVLIYFDVDVKRAILDGVRGLMSPDGVLFLGATETNVADGWTSTVKDRSTHFKVKR